MFYHPNSHRLGVRDIAAAWIVCFAVSGLGVLAPALGPPTPSIEKPPQGWPVPQREEAGTLCGATIDAAGAG